VQDALAKVNEVAEEACSSVKTVRSFAGEQLEVTRYSDMLKTVYALNVRESIAYSGYTWSTQVSQSAACHNW
jgi:ATP-binding cassette subfamily B (MDR/TAP) protein 9